MGKMPIQFYLSSQQRAEMERAWYRFRMSQVSQAQNKPAHIILTVPRTGSNLLIWCLNRLPKTFFFYEPLNESVKGLVSPSLTGEPCLEELARLSQIPRCPISGFKIMFSQLANRKISVGQVAEKFPHAKYIVLFRRDLLMTYISLQLANQTGQWLLFRRHQREKARIEFRPDDYLYFCQRVMQFYREILEQSSITQSALFVEYETFSQNRVPFFKETLCPFLGVEFKDCWVGLERQATYHCPSEAVSNPEAIRPHLQSAERYLDWIPTSLSPNKTVPKETFEPGGKPPLQNLRRWNTEVLRPPVLSPES